MATILGTAVNFGFASTANGATITNFTGILQSAKLTMDGDVEETKDGDGDLAAETHYNASVKAELEIVVTGASIAAAITNSAIGTNGAKGTFLTISACVGMPELVATSWRIMESSHSKSNTTSSRLNFSLVKHAGVTAVAS